MKPILEIQNVSKKYVIGHQRTGYLSLRERIINTLSFRRDSIEDFWALNNISFNVDLGESVGIIGRNGAGKSTLLKILSKITPPTRGSIISRGRIASLLEVGTGFHPELTGRENIFFNGSLLGMKKKEIKSRFDEIVDFSGTERFLDTPLKHYSSGMQLRLAFSVASFLDPEILIIDEVLAVGDAVFQKKCLGKMKTVAESGRTILFVSHHMGMIQQLCKKVLWIDEGGLKRFGNSEVINEYLFESSNNRRDTRSVQLGHGLAIENVFANNNPVNSLGEILISFDLKTEKEVTIDSLGFFVNNTLNERVAIIDLRKDWYKLRSGEKMKVVVNIRCIPLIEGEYKLGIFLGSSLLNGNFEDLLSLQVIGPERKTDVVQYPLHVRGKMEFDYEFRVEKAENFS